MAPQHTGDDGTAPTEQAGLEDVRAIRNYVAHERPGGLGGFDIVVEGTTPGDDLAAAAAAVAPWEAAGEAGGPPVSQP